jgi:hypothetical protein
MGHEWDSNEELLKAVRAEIEDLLGEVVLVGGVTTLLFVDAGVRDIRATTDVDVLFSANRTRWYEIGNLLRFTKRGLAELTEAQRFAVDNRITAAYGKHFSDSGKQMIEATSFYSPSVDGALRKSEIAEIAARRKAAGLGSLYTGSSGVWARRVH